jgi:hypothetical protein
MAAQDTVARALLHRYPRSYAQEAGIRSLTGPQGLFQLLVLSLLMSARIRADIALRAARDLFDAGWTTARRMTDAGWDARTRVLNRAGYARYDERTSRMLGETSDLLLERYAGDLRKLRDAAQHDIAKERRLLKECKGIGDVGVDIFFREVQESWTELWPFADKRALHEAERLGLGKDTDSLVSLVDRGDFTHLVDALVRADLDGISSADDLEPAATR